MLGSDFRASITTGQALSSHIDSHHTMASKTMLLPVSLSSRFFDGSAGSELHAIRRNEQERGRDLSGASVRANERTGRVALHYPQTGDEQDGRIQAVNDLECVMLLDEGTQASVRAS